MAKQSPTQTPLMRQYLSIKDEYPDAILFFRLGDFYEMFFDDAVNAARMLDLTLTSRNKNSDEAVPMCGLPHHAARGYIARLTELGQKVVLCEQVEDPKLAKGLVKREVVQIITPGVVLDDEVLDPKQARYLAAVTCEGGRFGLAYLDVSTGEFRATELASGDALIGELARVRPREILASAAQLADGGALAPVRAGYRDAAFSPIEPLPWRKAQDLLASALAGGLDDLGLSERHLTARAAADVIAYARATQPAGNLPLSRLQVYEAGECVVLDEAAIANLELTETLIGARRAGSLLSVVDATCTAPGGRLLRRWLLYPLTVIAPIRRRQDAIAFLVTHASLRQAVREQLDGVHDLERLCARVCLGVATPRDLGRLRDSLARLPALAAALGGAAYIDAGQPSGQRCDDDGAGVGLDGTPALLCFAPELMAGLAALQARLDAALVDEPGPMAKDGGFVRDGFCPQVDEHRRLADGGKDAILSIENRERERTGIGSLKVKYNRVFGYYIEVTKTNLARVPKDYMRKQTVATGERYVTSELTELEVKVLGAQERLIQREQEILAELCAAVNGQAALVREAGGQVATIDCCAALAEVAHKNGYVRPTVDEGDIIDIKEGRHPVVERAVPPGAFVPNDCRLDPNAEQVLLITGPNMAGKSTFMRQVAQIVLLAQAGSFVPARSATIGVVDRIFTRVGAADNLARGESTFMVEMREAAAILKGATRRSLVVLDEVGRGTSTFDGVSIAWAVTEYLHDAIGARTVFATHYHELCALAETRPRVRNVSVAVREHEGEIVFLRQVVAGGASRSYGIDVARLAGLPRSVIARARQILGQLEAGAQWDRPNQLSLFAIAQSGAQAAIQPDIQPDIQMDANVDERPREPADGATAGGSQPDPDGERAHALLARLRAVDPHRMTPLDALQLLAELCEQAR